MTGLKTLTKGLLGATALTVLSSQAAMAANNYTPAGTTVGNTFTLSYTTGTANLSINNSGSPTNFTVDRLINVNVTSPTNTVGTAQAVSPTQTFATLLFEVTNNGNDEHNYVLSLEESTTDGFTTGTADIRYIVDADGASGCTTPTNDGSAQSGTTVYSGSVPQVGPDDVICVYVAHTIPSTGPGAAGAEDGENAEVRLSAQTAVSNATTSSPVVIDDSDADTGGNTVTGAAENVLADTTGPFTNDDAGDGEHSDSSFYIVAAANVTAVKEVFLIENDSNQADCKASTAAPTTASNNNATNYFLPESCVEYVISITNSGSQAATSVGIVDNLQNDLNFVSAVQAGFSADGTLTLDGAAVPSGGAECMDASGPTAAVECEVEVSGATVAAATSGGGGGVTPTVATLKIRALIK